jgi:DNA-binding response OmpR family regulator
VHGLRAHSGEQTVSLTRRERDLLACLARAPNQTFSRAEISRDVYGSDLMAYNSRTIDSHMNRARDKLGQIGEAQRVQSVWGVGYRIER